MATNKDEMKRRKWRIGDRKRIAVREKEDTRSFSCKQ